MPTLDSEILFGEPWTIPPSPRSLFTSRISAYDNMGSGEKRVGKEGSEAVLMFVPQVDACPSPRIGER